VTLRGLLCVAPLNILRHRPRRIQTALGSAFRCDDCSAARATVLEFDGEHGYVDPLRRPFARDERYVSRRDRERAAA
jgi:hypothetical protein